MRCLPMGKPMACSSCSREKLNMRVSDEIDFLEERMALAHCLDWRNVGRGVVDSEGVVSAGSWSTRREASSREPMWYWVIITLAVSESGRNISSDMLKLRGSTYE